MRQRLLHDQWSHQNSQEPVRSCRLLSTRVWPFHRANQARNGGLILFPAKVTIQRRQRRQRRWISIGVHHVRCRHSSLAVMTLLSPFPTGMYNTPARPLTFISALAWIMIPKSIYCPIPRAARSAKSRVAPLRVSTNRAQ